MEEVTFDREMLTAITFAHIKWVWILCLFILLLPHIRYAMRQLGLRIVFWRHRKRKTQYPALSDEQLQEWIETLSQVYGEQAVQGNQYLLMEALAELIGIVIIHPTRRTAVEQALFDLRHGDPTQATLHMRALIDRHETARHRQHMARSYSYLAALTQLQDSQKSRVFYRLAADEDELLLSPRRALWLIAHNTNDKDTSTYENDWLNCLQQLQLYFPHLDHLTEDELPDVQKILRSKGWKNIDTLLTAVPENPSALMSTINELTAYADALHRGGEIKMELDVYRTILSIYQTRQSVTPHHLQYRYTLAMAWHHIGEIYAENNYLDESIHALQEGLKCTVLIFRDELSPGRWYDLRALTYEKLGDMYQRLERYRDAIWAYRKSIKAIQYAYRYRKNDDDHRQHAILYEKLGDSCTANNFWTRALYYRRHSLKKRQKIVALQPPNHTLLRDLSIGYERMGDVFYARGSWSRAMKYYDKGLELIQQLIRQHPENIVWQQDQNILYERIAEIQSNRKKWHAAFDAYKENLTVITNLIATQQHDTIWRRILALCWRRFGNFYATQKDGSAAIKNYRESLLITEELLAIDPQRLLWQIDYIHTCCNLAEIERDKSQSLAWVERARGALQRLYEYSYPQYQYDWIFAAEDRVGALTKGQ